MFRLKQTIAALLVLSCSFSIAQQTTNNASANQKEKEPANILEQRAEYFARQHGARPGKIQSCPGSRRSGSWKICAGKRNYSSRRRRNLRPGPLSPRPVRQLGHQHHAVDLDRPRAGAALRHLFLRTRKGTRG